MARKHLSKDEAAVARSELLDIGAWLAGVMADHGGRSAMVRTMVVDGEVVLAANIYTQGGGMGAPSAALEFREVMG